MHDDYNNLSSWFIVAQDQDKDGDVDFMGLANSGGGNALMFITNGAADGYTNPDGTPRLFPSSQGFHRQHVRFWDGNSDGYYGYVATDGDVGLVYRDRTAGGLDPSGEQQVPVQWCASCNWDGSPRYGQLSYLDVGDIDGDGNTDVVAIGNRFNPFVRVFYNQGGALVPGAIIRYPGGDWDGTGVRLADFDGDGRLDIVFTKLIDPNSPAATYNVYRNNGDGTFTGFSLPKNLSVTSLGVADANGDGKPDVFVSAFGEDDGTGNTIPGSGGVYLFTNTSAGGNISFTVSKVYSVDSSHYVVGLDAGDLNGDGFADMVFAVSNGDPSASQHPEVWAGDGTGNFTLAWTDTGANVVVDTLSIIKYNGRPALAGGGYRGAYLFANFGLATPPVVTVPSNLTAEATSRSGAIVTFAASASDDSGPVPVNCSPASGSTFALGVTTVTCSATNAGGQTIASFNVTVGDTTPPVLSLPVPLTVEATNAAGATVSYSGSASDLVSGAVAVACSPTSGSTFQLGTTTVNCSASDAAGNTAHGSFTVAVRDTTPPDISQLTPSRSALWPPNHQMVAITLTAVATDNVGVTQLKIVNATSSEPDNGLGDGDTAGDIVISGPLTVNLRAERSGGGNGRTYTITVEARDSAGNATTRSTTVFVPKSQGK
ncbi:MAG: VCBS repeat-containing protein [Acidobacteria bacterium]|nr:VCBS repeat-containing protein [Acidobacteriota bacterium]